MEKMAKQRVKNDVEQSKARSFDGIQQGNTPNRRTMHPLQMHQAIGNRATIQMLKDPIQRKGLLGRIFSSNRDGEAESAPPVQDSKPTEDAESERTDLAEHVIAIEKSTENYYVVDGDQYEFTITCYHDDNDEKVKEVWVTATVNAIDPDCLLLDKIYHDNEQNKGMGKLALLYLASIATYEKLACTNTNEESQQLLRSLKCDKYNDNDKHFIATMEHIRSTARERISEYYDLNI